MEWTQEQLRQLAGAYQAKNPTWTAPGVTVPTFDPNNDPAYVAGTGAVNSGLDNLYTSLGFNPTTGAYGGGAYDRGAQSYGYDAQGGRITDPNSPLFNPYSRAALLQKSYENTQRYTSNSLAERGLGTSGLAIKDQADASHNYSVGDDELRRSATNYYAGLRDQAVAGTDDARIDTAGMVSSAFDKFVAGQATQPPPAYTPTPEPKKRKLTPEEQYRADQKKILARQNYYSRRARRR